MKLAAIDIGSNAVRLLISNVIETGEKTVFKKVELVRVPIRLGEDSFTKGFISEKKILRLVKTMHAFRLLIDSFEAEGFRVCATAAMREAANKEDVIKKVESETGLNIEIVDGKTEAQIIYSNHIAEELNTEFDYLYIDVGGGSTEITLFSKNKIVASQSFNVGTIRLLHEQVGKETWDYLKNWVTQKAKSINPLMAIGSGGNINKLYKLVHGKDTKPMTYKKLKEVSDYISEFSYEERITHLGLNDDRADVILPASKIFMTIMKTAAIDKIIVPQSGLSDGIIHLLYEQMKTQTKLFK